MKPERVAITTEESLTLIEAVKKIGNAVTDLRLSTGVNLEGTIVLLQDHTKLPKKTIKKVLTGLSELYDRYSEQVKN